MQDQILNTVKTVLFSLFVAIFSFFTAGSAVFAHQPDLIFLKQGDVQINNPETSQAFYDELTGNPKNYFITSAKDFNLYINLLVPEIANKDGRYSANIFLVKDNIEEKIALLDGATVEWSEFYESFGRDYYLKGPELEKPLPAGKYKIEIFSTDQTTMPINTGKYVLAVGKTESYNIRSFLNIYWQIPTLKIKFFQTSVWQFFLTPFGIIGIAIIGLFIIILAILNYLIALIRQKIKHAKAKTILLTSSGMQMKSEITKLLQKPAYDITVAFIITAAKQEDNLDYVKRDYEVMREMGFNILEVDIEGKTESQVTDLIKLKDIIYVEGGNTFYLLKAMRQCNFEKIIKKLLKEGKVYLGASAGSVVAGKTIKTSKDENIVNLKNMRGLNLVPFDIFCHYTPEYDTIIKKKFPFKWQRRKIKFLKDDQAILVQAKSVMLLGNQDEVII